jgi:DNA-binding transcriptional ArsR family regulator
VAEASLIRIPMTTESLARSRFVISPLAETVQSLRVLRDPGRTPQLAPWVRSTRSVLRHEPDLERRRGHQVALLTALVPSAAGYVPDFLTPPPISPGRTVDDDLADVAATPPGRLHAELELTYRGRHPPAVVQQALSDGDQDFLDHLAGALRRYWTVAVAPYWPEIRGVLERDILYRGRTLAQHGAAKTIAQLHRDLAWNKSCVQIDKPYSIDVEWAEQGLLFSPSVFGGSGLYLVDAPSHQPVVYHPARGIDGLWPAATRSPDGLSAELIGATRAAILADLDVPRSTSELAARQRLSPGAVSYHLGVLHREGLLDRTRHGRIVLYQRTTKSNPLR